MKFKYNQLAVVENCDCDSSYKCRGCIVKIIGIDFNYEISAIKFIDSRKYFGCFRKGIIKVRRLTEREEFLYYIYGSEALENKK